MRISTVHFGFVAAVAASRFLVVVVLAATVTAAAVPAAAGAADARGLQANSPELEVLDAASGAFASGTHGGQLLRLRKVSPDITSIRRGHGAEINITTRELAAHWSDLGFAANHPTATVDPHKGNRIAVKVWRPRLKGRRLTFRIRGLPGHASPRLGFTNLSIDASGADGAALEKLHDPAPGDPPGFWVEFHTYVDAWGGDGDCSGATWGIDGGNCFGTFPRGGTDPYNGSRTSNGYFGWDHGTDSVYLDAGRNQFQQGGLNGRTPGRGSPEFYVNDSSWFWNQTNFKVQSGSDASQLGQRGGPVSIDVEYHSAGPFTNSGYTMDAHGYLWCVPARGDCTR
jgi:hypothetical protein